MNYEASEIRSNESAELADSLKLEKFHKEIYRKTKTVLIKHKLQFMNNSHNSFFHFSAAFWTKPPCISQYIRLLASREQWKSEFALEEKEHENTSTGCLEFNAMRGHSKLMEELDCYVMVASHWV